MTDTDKLKHALVFIRSCASRTDRPSFMLSALTTLRIMDEVSEGAYQSAKKIVFDYDDAIAALRRPSGQTRPSLAPVPVPHDSMSGTGKVTEDRSTLTTVGPEDPSGCGVVATGG